MGTGLDAADVIDTSGSGTRAAHRAMNARRILCIAPRHALSFGTFQHSRKLLPGLRAFMPSLGLLSIAAYLPDAWEVRFVDENGGAATEADWRWADAVFTTGMHVQRRMIADIVDRAHAHDKIVVLGGPSVSAAPHYYPEPDIIHIGELGDATDAVIAALDHSGG